MLTKPPDLSDLSVAEAVNAGWGLPVDRMEHAPVGFGGRHWSTWSDGRRWFVTVDDLEVRQRNADETLEDAARRLIAALDTAEDSAMEWAIFSRILGS